LGILENSSKLASNKVFQRDCEPQVGRVVFGPISPISCFAHYLSANLRIPLSAVSFLLFRPEGGRICIFFCRKKTEYKSNKILYESIRLRVRSGEEQKTGKNKKIKILIFENKPSKTDETTYLTNLQFREQLYVFCTERTSSLRGFPYCF